jgi:Tol biopolymer transport system component
MGTTNYMSPEQARGQEVDARADLWSWGVVFYEMLAGRPPFTGATSSDVIAEILKGEPPPLRTDLPDSMSLILRKSLSKDKEDRYGAMTELIDELRGLSRELEGGSLNFPFPQDAPKAGDARPHDDSPTRASSADRPKEIERGTDREGGLILASVTSPAQTVSTFGASTLSPKPGWHLSKAALRQVRGLPLYARASGLLAVMLALAIYGLVRRQAAHMDPPLELPRTIHLTKDGRVMDAAISGDGRRLAYVLIESGKQILWVRELESGEELQLLPPGHALRWGMRFMPDGQSLLYVTTPPDSSAGELYRVPVRGGPSDRLVTNVAGPPAVSPDGAQVAFIRTYPVQHRDVLITANIDGSAEREIASRQHPDKFSFSGPSWSPDGKRIALGAGRNNETECAVLGVPVDGGVPVELTPWQWAAVGGVAWDSDGRALIFSARELGKRVLQIWRLSHPSGEMRRITEDENAYEEVTLAPGTNTLVTTHTYEVSNIWAVNSSGEARRLTTQGHEGADGLAVSPSGRIIYTVGEYEQSILWSMNMDGSDRRRLAENNGFLPSASRDGRFVAYVSTESGVHHVWLMEADGRNNRQLTDGQGEFNPSITPDGNWVVYASLAKERSSLWKIPTGGGSPIQLTPGIAARRPVVSPDGTMLACAYRRSEAEEWRIAVLPFDGGAPLKTFAFPFPRNQMIRWTPDSKALIYLDRRDGVHNLWSQQLDESAPNRITDFKEDMILHHDGASAGAEIVLSRGGRRRDIALIKGFE